MCAKRCMQFLLILAMGVCAFVSPCPALDASNVLVLYADDGDGNPLTRTTPGGQIADYYLGKHNGVATLALTGLPSSALVPAPALGTGAKVLAITADQYLTSIRPQIIAALDANPNIQCIVTTKDLPLRIYNPSYGLGNYKFSSLESELTTIRTVSTASQMGASFKTNPYYQKTDSFVPSSYNNMYLTSRLDGYTVSEVNASLDRAQKAAVLGWEGGYVHIDDSPNKTDYMEVLRDSVLIPDGVNFSYDGTSSFVASAPANEPGWAAIGYVSHGRNGGAPEHYVNQLAFPLAPGAVFTTWESWNAYTFTDGVTSPYTTPYTTPYMQGQIADWLRHGGTAGVGNVYEPSASGWTVTNENLMYAMLLSGRSWAESAWAATPQVSYVNTVIGDPLMTFRQWLPGDVDGNGIVDVGDLALVVTNYGHSAVGWWSGDLNGDGEIDVSDLAILSTNYGKTLGAPVGGGAPQSAAAPEPTMMVLLLSGLAILRRHR